MGWSMHSGAGGGLMMIGMVLFWGALILGLVWIVREGASRGQREADQGALAILDRRFAEGALSVAEYHERREVLLWEQGVQSPPPDGASSLPRSRTKVKTRGVTP